MTDILMLILDQTGQITSEEYFGLYFEPFYCHIPQGEVLIKLKQEIFPNFSGQSPFFYNHNYVSAEFYILLFTLFLISCSESDKARLYQLA